MKDSKGKISLFRTEQEHCYRNGPDSGILVLQAGNHKLFPMQTSGGAIASGGVNIKCSCLTNNKSLPAGR